MAGAEVLFLLGGADNYTDARFCHSLVAELQNAGVPASHKTYAGAHHGFIRDRDRYLKRAATFNRCGTVTLREDGYHVGDGFSDRSGS